MLLGSAMLGAVAGGAYPNDPGGHGGDDARGDRGRSRAAAPRPTIHEAKHRVFLRMYDDQMAYRDLMA